MRKYQTEAGRVIATASGTLVGVGIFVGYLALNNFDSLPSQSDLCVQSNYCQGEVLLNNSQRERDFEGILGGSAAVVVGGVTLSVSGRIDDTIASRRNGQGD